LNNIGNFKFQNWKIEEKSQVCKYVLKVQLLFVRFSQMHANPNSGQFLMSYSNGLAGSSPKFVSMEGTSGNIVTAG
jgi:hypothetical protein